MSTQTPLHLDLLGRFRLHQDDEYIRLPIGKTLLVLAVLACSRHRTARRDRLASLLWEDSDIEPARASLRQALSRLRSGLGPLRGALWSDNEQVGLSEGCWVIDIDALARSEGDESATVDAGWAAPFLAGVHRREPAIDAWLEGERQRHQQLVGRVFQAAIDRALENGQAARALELGTCLGALDPFAEPVHRSMMLAHELKGDRASALRQYRTLVRLLDQGLGVAPDERTRELFERLRQAPGPDSRASALCAVSTPLSSGDAQRLPPPVAEPTESLRLVTVLAIHRRDAGLSADDRQAIDASLRRHGGEEILSHGSEAMHVFGLHGSGARGADAACRAVQPLRDSAAFAGSLACGCASGLVGLDDEGWPVGSVVQRAARLALLADDGELIIDRAVRAQLSLSLEVEEVTLRNQSGYRVLDMSGRRSVPATEIFGRRLELSQLCRLLEDSVTRGPSMALVSGEAGMGKTHLLAALEHAARANGNTVLRVAFSTHEASPESLTGQLTRQLHDALTERGGSLQFDEVQRSTLTRLLSDTGGDSRQGHPHNEQQHRSDLLAALLDRLSCIGPVLLIAEDCHWADPGDIDLLIDLLERQTGRPVSLVTSERRENETVARALQSRVIDAEALHLTLTPLSRPDAHALVASRVPDEAMQRRILDRAGGNPLFLTQLVEADLGSDAAVPVSVIALVQDELDRTSERVRSACLRAAVLGPEFGASTLDSVFPDIDRSDLLDSRLLGLHEDRWQFRHALVHEAVYSLLGTDDSARLHRQLAEHFRSSNPGEHAHHALRCGDSSLAIQASARASQWLLGENRRADAERMVNLGMALDPEGDARARLLMSRAQLLRDRGDIDDAVAAFRHAHDCSESADLKVQALVRTATLLARRDALDRAASQLRAASAIAAERTVSDEVLAELEHEWGNNMFMRGEVARCRQHHLRARQLADRGHDVRLQAAALGGLGDAFYAEGKVRTAHGYFTRCLTLAEDNDLRLIAIEHRGMHAYCANLLIPGEKAMEGMFRAVDEAHRWKHTQYEMLSRVALADGLVMAHRIEESMEQVRRVNELESRYGGQRFAPDVLFVEILRLWAIGEMDGARRLAADGVERFGSQRYMGPTFHATLAAVTDDESVARRALTSGRHLLDKGGLAHNRVAYPLLASASHWRRGDIERARTVIEQARRGFGAELVGQVEVCRSWMRQAERGVPGTREAAEVSIVRQGMGLLAITHPWRLASSGNREPDDRVSATH